MGLRLTFLFFHFNICFSYEVQFSAFVVHIGKVLHLHPDYFILSFNDFLTNEFLCFSFRNFNSDINT